MLMALGPLSPLLSQPAGTESSDAATQPAVSSGASTDKSLADQQTFLKLLVTQLQMQDPLNPMDGTAFVSQLTQFSELEQLLSIDNGIKSMLQLLQGQVSGNSI
jgi:flagellar basal-body rod modification protein FlgD